MQATVAVPYGAVASYAAGIARELGQPAAVRAVAQALRHNPLPIVVPMPSHHRRHRQARRLRRQSDQAERDAAPRVEGVPVRCPRRRASSASAMYHYDTNPDHQYCLPTCGEHSASSRSVSFASSAHREQAAASGLEPCLDCRPDLHPLCPLTPPRVSRRRLPGVIEGRGGEHGNAWWES